MPYLLDLIYLALLVGLSPWLVYQSLRAGKYRQGWGAKLLGNVPERGSRNDICVWLHAVSVGEVNVLVPLVERLAEQCPSWRCVISTTTATGYALARSRFPQHEVFYCPLDFSWSTRRALRRLRPQLLVLTELELWPNLICAARRQGVRIAVVNGRLSERSFRGYRRLGLFARALVRQLDLVAAQSDTVADRFRALGVPADRVHVTGSIKFDGAETDRGNSQTVQLRTLAGICDNDVVFLAGSTQEPEESLALDAYLALCDQYPRLKLLIVPRHPERFDAVARLLTARGVAFRRRSELEINHKGHKENKGMCKGDHRVLLVDTIGELSAWWGVAQAAFVGGSLSRRGGQNMIEPAAYGAAVCFGPNTRNFRDVVEGLLVAQAAVVVHDGAELREFVRRCLDDPAYASELGLRARRHVLGQLGATERTCRLLIELADDDGTGVVTRTPLAA